MRIFQQTLFLILFFSLLPFAFAYDFLDKEFFGLAKSVHTIRHDYPPSDYVYVGIGRSPAPMIALHQIMGDQAFNVPMTWSESVYAEQLKKIRDSQNKEQEENFSLTLQQVNAKDLQFSIDHKNILYSHLDQYLGPAIKLGLQTGKKLLITDFVNTGAGLFLTNLFMNDYLEDRGLKDKIQVEYLGIGLDKAKDLKFGSQDWHSLILNDADTNTFHLSLIFKRMKDYAEYGNFLVDKPSPLEPNPKYLELQQSIQKRLPTFQHQISRIQEQTSMSKLEEFHQLIASKIKDGMCHPQKTLVVFDIDSVLTVDELDERYPQTHEVDTSKVVKDIQALGVSTMALTNRNAIEGKEIPPKFFKTAKELYKMGIDFHQSAALIEKGLELNKHMMVFGPNSGYFDGRKSLYYRGIFSLQHDLLGKGNRLNHLLTQAGLLESFDCLFFVDDQMINLHAVQSEFRYKMHLWTAQLLPTPPPISSVLIEVLDDETVPAAVVDKGQCQIEELE